MKLKHFLIFIPVFILFVVNSADAEPMYVSNIIKITLRSGPGTDHKVLQMIQSGQEVQVLETAEGWSKIQMSDGKEGWVLTRFLSEEKPSSMVLQALEKDHTKLLEKATTLKTENTELREENQRLSKELKTVQENLSQTSTDYETLKKGSKEFLELKSKYQQSTSELAKQTQKAEQLDQLLLQRNITLFLLGAGVLVFGIIIGVTTKSGRRRSSLLA